MLNSIKMELYRIRTMKSAYILPIIMLVLILLTGFFMCKLSLDALGVDTSAYAEQTSSDSYDDAAVDGFSVGFQTGYDEAADVDGDSDDNDTLKLSDLFGEGIYYNADVPFMYYLNICGMNAVIMLAIFVGLFFGSEYSSGFKKNLTKYSRSRWLSFGSKAIAVSLYSVIFNVIVFLETAFSMLLFAEGVKWNMDSSFFAYFGLICILEIAFCMLIALLVTITRSTAAGITLGIVISTGLVNLVFLLFDLLLKYVFKLPDSVSINDYLITGNISMLTLDSDGATVIRALIVGVGFAAVYFVLSGIIVNKRDVI